MIEKIQRTDFGKPALLTITDRFFSSPVAKLKPGSIIYGEVTQVLDKNSILLKLLNREIVARTNLPLERGEQLKLWVKKQGMPMILELLEKPITQGMKNLLQFFSHKSTFNPLSNEPVKEFRDFVETKRFLKHILNLISKNPALKEKIVNMFSHLADKENYFVIPVSIDDKNIAIKGKVEKNKRNKGQNTETFLFSVETVNLGKIEVSVAVSPVHTADKKRIDVSFFVYSPRIADYIRPKLTAVVDLISLGDFVPGRINISVRPYEAFLLMRQ